MCRGACLLLAALHLLSGTVQPACKVQGQAAASRVGCWCSLAGALGQHGSVPGWHHGLQHTQLAAQRFITARSDDCCCWWGLRTHSNAQVGMQPPLQLLLFWVYLFPLVWAVEEAYFLYGWLTGWWCSNAKAEPECVGHGCIGMEGNAAFGVVRAGVGSWLAAAVVGYACCTVVTHLTFTT